MGHDDARLASSLARSVGAAHSLSASLDNANKSLSSAAMGAAHLSEFLAKAAGNSTLAAGATGLGALAAVGLSLVEIFRAATQQMQGFNAKLNSVATDTKVAQLSGMNFAKDILAQKQRILGAGEQELEQANQLANEDQKRLYRASIYKRVREQIAALDRQIAREASISSANQLADLRAANRILGAQLSPKTGQRDLMGNVMPFQGYEFTVGYARLNAAKNAAQDRLLDPGGTAETKHYSRQQIDDEIKEINKQFDLGLEVLQKDINDKAHEVGDSFSATLASSLSDGITTAIQSGSIGKGLEALTGSILIGFGNLMEEIGTHALVTAQLFSTIVNALRSFAPEGAIGPALALIAGGAVLKGIGASMGGSGRGGSYSGSSSGSSSSRTIVLGTIYPTGTGPNMSGLVPIAPVNVYATIIGERDPVAQTALIRMIKNANSRGRP